LDDGPIAPPEPPPELARAIAAAGARIENGWREASRGYLRAVGPDGRLFARWSDDPRDVEVLGHEVAIIAALAGRSGPLTAPALVAQGAGWLLEAEVAPEPLRGASVEIAAAAGAEIPSLALPDGPGAAPRARARAPVRALRVLRSPLPFRELLRARALLRRTPLPRVPSHGDLHAGNVLVAGGRAYVVDWELSGRRPLGWDLMQLWATLPDPADRPAMLEAALAMVGPSQHDALIELRYVVAVHTAASALGAVDAFDRDVEGGRRLVRELPRLRA